MQCIANALGLALSANNLLTNAIAWTEPSYGLLICVRLAKAAAELPRPHLSISNREINTPKKHKQRSATRRLGKDKAMINRETLDKMTQATVFRLGTGHCGRL